MSSLTLASMTHAAVRRSSLFALVVLIAPALCAKRAIAQPTYREAAPVTAFTTRLYLGMAHFRVDSESEPLQKSRSLNAQADVGFRLLEQLGLHAHFLYDFGLREIGAFGMGGGIDLRRSAWLTSMDAGWQATQFVTSWDDDAESAKSWFVSLRSGYVLAVGKGVGVGLHAFFRYFRARDDEQHGIRHDPKGFVLGGLVSVGFDGGRPLIRRTRESWRTRPRAYD